jgi:hypothetical protein
LILVYNKNKINKFPISLSKNDEISILKNSLVPRRRRNTTTLGFHGITMGNPYKYGRGTSLGCIFFLSFFLFGFSSSSSCPMQKIAFHKCQNHK